MTKAAVPMAEVMTLNVRQPAASCIAVGAKKIEFRTWQTRYRGPLLIVASKHPKCEPLPSGQAVCIVDLLDCEREEDGVYAWKLGNVRPVKPFDVRGKLGLYKVSVPLTLTDPITVTEGEAQMNNQIITFGYQGRRPEELLAECQRLDAVLCDIRFRPASRNPLWSGGKLRQMFRDRYVHIGELGNVNYKSGPIQIANMETGLQRVQKILMAQSVVLMCVCHNFAQCHRQVVAEELARKGVAVYELDLKSDEQCSLEF